MKIELELRPAGLPAALKRAKKGKIALVPGGELLRVPEGLALLREAADLCIERGLELTIEGVAPCLLPGYARYLAAAGAVKPCPEKGKCFLSETCRGIPAAHANLNGLFKPPARVFTDMEKCMLAVLARKNNITTAQVLKLAKGIKICSSCSNEGEVFRAAERLIRFGLVAKKYSGGVYLWTKRSA